MGSIDTSAAHTQAPDAASGRLGQAIGSYLIVEKLGEGGMAQVYKAYHTRLGRYVALKFVHPELAAQADFRRAFEQEARILARFSHPHIVHIYDVGETADDPPQPYLVMEYIAGRTLKDWLPEEGTLSLEQVLPILRQISTALDYAHAQGIIHRDIKPGNIMLTPDGRALLADFGISRLLRPGQEFVETHSTTGTPAYMAPEQVSPDIGPIGPACDVYALGVVVYEMLTGRRPFRGDTPLAEMVKRLQEPPTPPRVYNPALPEAVEQVVLKALAQKPAERYSRAGAFVTALAQAAPGATLTETPPGGVQAAPAWWPTAPVEMPPEPGEPPFKGLQHFDVGDAALFFGRETLSTRLLARLFPAPAAGKSQDGGFLAIVGASGSGKSSLARAGLIPVLPEGTPVYLLTPTAQPLEALALVLTRDSESVTAAATLMDDMTRDPRSLHLYVRRQQEARSRKQEGNCLPPAPGQPTPNPQFLIHQSPVLVVDQFEEVFTLCHDATARRAFVDNVLTAAAAGVVRVVITLRADFYSHCAQYADLRDALAAHQVYIGPMTRDELRRAIEEPARRGGWLFEPGLVDLLLREVGDEPGGLPLLAHALLETWQRRRGRTLTLGGYAEAGGVRGAIAKTAEAVYQRLNPAQQAIARNLFVRLTELGEGTQDTRRRAALSELLPPGDEAGTVQAVLNELAMARLVTLEQDSAQVAHEALIREWPTLRGWLEEDREGLRVQRHLTEAAQAWERLSRDPGELYRGARLAQAAEWAAGTSVTLTPLEREFLAASQTEAERAEVEREAQRQRELAAAQRLAEAEQRRAEEGQTAARKLRLRARYLAVAAAGVLLIAILAALLWNRARVTSRENAALADENAVIAAENANIAATAVAVSEQEATQRTAAEAARSAEEAARIEANKQRTAAEAAQLEADRQRDAALQQARVALAGKLAAQSSLALEEQPDLALLMGLESYSLLDVPQTRGALLVALNNYPGYVHFLTGHTDKVECIAINPDGTIIASAGWDGTIRLWNVVTGQLIGQPLMSHPESVWSTLAFSPDGKTLAAGGCRMAEKTDPQASVGICAQDELVLWDVTSGQPVYSFPGQPGRRVKGAAYHPEGALLAVAYRPGPIILWDVATQTPIAQLRTNQFEGTHTVAFSPDGMLLAASIYNAIEKVNEGSEYIRGSIVLWDISTVVGSGDEKLSVNTETLPPLRVISPTGYIDEVRQIVFNPNGKLLAVLGCQYDATSDCNLNFTLWDAETGNILGTPLNVASAAGTGSIALSPSGEMLAGAAVDKVYLWNMVTMELINTLRLHSLQPLNIKFTPDGQTLVFGTDIGPVGFWDLTTQGRSGSYFIYDTTILMRLALSPDGTILAVGNYDGLIHLRRSNTGEAIMPPLKAHNAAVWNIAFSPDGSMLASGSADETIRLWNVVDGTPLSLPVSNPTYNDYFPGVLYVTFSPDGQLLASGDADGIIRLWNVASLLAGQPLSQTLIAHTDWPPPVTNRVPEVAFSPDGKFLASASWDNTIRLWDLTGQLIASLPHKMAYTVAFSPDGRVLASGGGDNAARLWDTGDVTKLGQPIGLPFNQGNRIWFNTFSPDGKTLATIDQDGKIGLLDVTTGQAIGLPLTGHTNTGGGLAFSPDSKTLYSSSMDGTVRKWNIDPAFWRERACTIVGRNFTQAEWTQYLPGEPYRQTCPQWPVGE